MSNKNLQLRYGISVQEIVRDYYDMDNEKEREADDDARRV